MKSKVPQKYRKEPHYKVLEAHAPADFINDKVNIGSTVYSFGLESKKKAPLYSGAFSSFSLLEVFLSFDQSRKHQVVVRAD